MTPVMHAASAIAPGIPHVRALAAIAEGLSDPVLGPISMAKVQLCPQHNGRISEDLVEKLSSAYPETELRVHAAPKLTDAPIAHVYASNLPQYDVWVGRLVDLTKRMGSGGYSIHAGLRSESTMDEMIDNACRLQDRLPDTRVAIEGLYPAGSNRWLMSSWAEYEQVANSAIGFALDLSHLNIVARKHGREDALVEDLIAHPGCVEVHVSHNDGRMDAHQVLEPAEEPWWMPMIAKANPAADFFYEGILVR